MAQLFRGLRPLVRPLIAWNYAAGWPTRMSAGTPVPDVADQVRVGRFVTGVLRDQIRVLNETALAPSARYDRVNFVALPPIENTDFIDDVFSYASLYAGGGITSRLPPTGSWSTERALRRR